MTNEDRIQEAIIRLWSTSARYTTYMVAEATREIGGDQPLSATEVGRVLQRWEGVGVAELQPNSLRQGSTLWRFAWGPGSATLGDVLKHGLVQLSTSHVRRLRTAMRRYLEIPDGTDEALVASAHAVPASELFGLPERVAKAGETHGLATSTLRSWVSTVRAMLATAARENVVAVVFPRHHADDAWEAACDRWFWGADHVDMKRETLQTYASVLLGLRSVLQGLDRQVSPTELSLDALEDEILPHIVSDLGRPSFGREVRKVLRFVGRVYAEGPYADPGDRPSDRPHGYLRPPKGPVGDGCIESLVSLLAHHGFQEDVQEFVRWYHSYSTIPDDELWRREDEYPSRPAKRRLKPQTWRMRCMALRALGLQLCHLAQERDVPLDMPNTFGDLGIRAAKEVELWWRDRAAAGEVASAHSQGLQQILLCIGLWARAAYDRELHRDGRATVDDRHDALSGGALRSAASHLPSAARAYLRLYEHTRARSDVFIRARKRSLEGHAHTDRKEILRIYRNTPPRFWHAIGQGMQDRIRQWDRKRGDRFHRLVLDAFTHGLLLSTGCRGNELAWLRLRNGTAFPPEGQLTRTVEWEAWHRKNLKAHSATILDAFLPVWLEKLYLEESRPFFIARGLERGHIQDDHDFLIVQPKLGDSLTGGWFPSTAEDREEANDRVRKPLALARLRWQSQAARVAADLGLSWPVHLSEGGLHAVRNSMGFGLAVVRGIRAAADYLGDSEKSVRDTYEATSGLNLRMDPRDKKVIGFLVDRDEQTWDEGDLVEPQESDLHSHDVSRLKQRIQHLEQLLDDARGAP